MGGSHTTCIESELAKTFKEGMDHITNRMCEQQQLANQSMQSFSDDARDDKPVQGIPILDPEFGYKIKIRDFVSWIKSVEGAWGKVSSTVTRALRRSRWNWIYGSCADSALATSRPAGPVTTRRLASVIKLVAQSRRGYGCLIIKMVLVTCSQ